MDTQKIAEIEWKCNGLVGKLDEYVQAQYFYPDMMYLISEVRRLNAKVEEDEKWFNSNAGVLASHNIGGFSFL